MKMLAMWVAAVCLCMGTAVYGFPMFDDFESGLDPAWTGGTISTDQAVSGEHSLMLGDGEIALFDFSPEGGGNAGQLSLWVYDNGVMLGEGNYSGPRWGLYSEDKGQVANLPDGQSVIGGGLVWRSFLNADNGYARSDGLNPVTDGTWFSPYFQGGPRVEGWMKWSITLDQDFNVTIDANLPDGTLHSTTTVPGVLMFDRAIGPNPPSGARGIYLFGGKDDAAGLYVDDVNWIPEPACLSLLLLGSLMLFKRN